MIDLQISEDIPPSMRPDPASLQDWVSQVLARHQSQGEVSLRITDNAEIQALNKQYRHKDKPTNVLSFPADLPEGVDIALLGDIVIAAPVVEAEAQEQNKTIEAHWAHMVVHGVLHLLGYDHIEDDEAEQMEAEEIAILTTMGFNNPYQG